MTININKLVRPIGIKNDRIINFAGSAFGLEKPGLMVTAAHIVSDVSCDRIFLEHGSGRRGKSNRFWQPISVVVHPTADIAVMNFEADNAIPFFKIAKPPDDIQEFHLGTEIVCYGYPSRIEGPNLVSLEPRLLRGYTERRLLPRQGWRDNLHEEYELSFSSPQGYSGSPVLLVDDMTTVLAMITGNLGSEKLLGEFEEHLDNGHLEKTILKEVVSHGMGLALWPFADWIRSQ